MWDRHQTILGKVLVFTKAKTWGCGERNTSPSYAGVKRSRSFSQSPKSKYCQLSSYLEVQGKNHVQTHSSCQSNPAPVAAGVWSLFSCYQVGTAFSFTCLLHFSSLALLNLQASNGVANPFIVWISLVSSSTFFHHEHREFSAFKGSCD